MWRPKGAAIVQADFPRRVATARYVVAGDGPPSGTVETEIPLGGGVASWAIVGRTPVACSNVFTDDRFVATRDFAKTIGYAAAAVAPMTLDGTWRERSLTDAA